MSHYSSSIPKVVIVLSRGYVESKWCQFELDLSHHRLLESERRNALVLILLEDVPKQQQNAGLRYLMSTRTYLEWRSDPEGQKLFWQRLRQVLTVPHPTSEPILNVHASTWFRQLLVHFSRSCSPILVRWSIRTCGWKPKSAVIICNLLIESSLIVSYQQPLDLGYRSQCLKQNDR